MRTIQTCGCGASLEVVASAPNSVSMVGRDREAAREWERVNKLLDRFRQDHEDCRRASGPVYVQPTAPPSPNQCDSGTSS